MSSSTSVHDKISGHTELERRTIDLIRRIKEEPSVDARSLPERIESALSASKAGPMSQQPVSGSGTELFGDTVHQEADLNWQISTQPGSEPREETTANNRDQFQAEQVPHEPDAHAKKSLPLFCLDRPDSPVMLADEQQREAYLAYLSDTSALDSVVADYEQLRGKKTVIENVKRLISNASKKSRGLSGKSDPEEILGMVEAHILPKISKIARCVFSEACKAPQQFHVDLSKALCAFLAPLGVFTVLAEPGDVYDGDLMHYYSAINISEGSTVRPLNRIEYVDFPAYVIDYDDGTGANDSICREGKCYLKVEEI